MADYTVSVAFPFEMSTYGERTRTLERAVGKDSDGAGTGDGERDVSWYFKSAPAAVAAFQKLHRVKWLTRCGLTRDNV